MTVWDFLDKLIAISPPVLAVLLIAAAGVLFLVGFDKHGADFLKHGFKQTDLDASPESRFDALEQSINRIETNHFGHLKNYLGILNGVLLDKQIIDNETKARLDNELRDM
jgi:hypothetical protein